MTSTYRMALMDKMYKSHVISVIAVSVPCTMVQIIHIFYDVSILYDL